MTTPIKLVQRFYKALARGDIPAVLTVLDPHVEWTKAERFPYYGGTWHSPHILVPCKLSPPLGPSSTR